ncbi:hypothetical protein D8674_017777 [Pyrus ussuriensis x Pyrus communis]|uniref:Uncharacterized protein n=1 Tax=Pyrus ussuriensis x Pyrus communis TaxID=2448454 RepID=A0A5N5HGV4_9ROSA|nr:hypothetical protein D8674_017777 [Pyrus ussuriensis x Pyrus communis]
MPHHFAAAAKLLGSVVATFPPNMTTMSVSLVTPFSLTVSTAPTSSTSLMKHPLLSARQTHRRPQSSEEAEQDSEASSIHGPRQVMHLSHSFRKCYSFGGGSAEFSWGSNFPEIVMFNEVYVQPRDELKDININYMYIKINLFVFIFLVHHGGEGPNHSRGGGFPASPRDPDRGGVSP